MISETNKLEIIIVGILEQRALFILLGTGNRKKAQNAALSHVCSKYIQNCNV